MFIIFTYEKMFEKSHYANPFDTYNGFCYLITSYTSGLSDLKLNQLNLQMGYNLLETYALEEDYHMTSGLLDIVLFWKFQIPFRLFTTVSQR